MQKCLCLTLHPIYSFDINFKFLGKIDLYLSIENILPEHEGHPFFEFKTDEEL
jgi:hypothetical protein